MRRDIEDKVSFTMVMLVEPRSCMTFKRVSAEGQGEIWWDLAQGVMVNSRGGLLRRQFAVRVVTAHEGRPVARRPVIDAGTQGPGEIDEEALYGDPRPGAQRPV